MEDSDPPGMLRTIKPFAASIGRQWRLLGIIGLLTALHAVLVALQPWPLKLLIDSVSGKPPSLPWISQGPALRIPAAALAGLTISFAMSALNSALSWFWSKAGQRLVLDLAVSLYDRLLRVSLPITSATDPATRWSASVPTPGRSTK